VPGMQGRDNGLYSGTTKAQRISELQKMQLVPATISIYRTAENSLCLHRSFSIAVQDSYVQTMKNKPYFLDLYRKWMNNISDLVGYGIHFRFYVVNKHQFTYPLPE